MCMLLLISELWLLSGKTISLVINPIQTLFQLEKENLLRSACTALLSAQAILETKVGDKNYDSVHLNLGR